MFKKTKLFLSAQYFLLICLVSIGSIIATYSIVRTEVIKGFQATHVDLVNQSIIPESNQEAAAQLFHAHEDNTLAHLVEQGGVIFVVTLLVAGLVSYVLSSIALKPIERTYDAQSNFIADASHELKTPLTGLMTRTEVALLKDNTSVKDLKSVLRKNLKSIKHLHGLIVNLLELTRIELGVLTLHPQTVAVKPLVEAIIDDVRSRYPDKEITIKTIIKKETVTADSIYLRQLLTVLVENAFKYTDSKGIVSILIGEEKGKLSIKISDSGVGIEKKSMSHIYQRFYRSDESNTDSFGLGLPLASKIVRAFNGSIGVQSRPGKGSEFQILLPLSL